MFYPEDFANFALHIADFQNEKGWEGHKSWKFRRFRQRNQNKRGAKGSFKFISKT